MSTFTLRTYTGRALRVRAYNLENAIYRAERAGFRVLHPRGAR